MVRKLTGWNIFVQKVKKENPSLTFGEVLKKASQLKKEGKMDKMSSSSSSSSTSIKNKKEDEAEEEEEGEGEEEPKHNIKKMKSRHSMKSKTFKKKHNFLQKKLRKTKRKSRKSRRSRKSRK